MVLFYLNSLYRRNLLQATCM